MEEGHEPIAQLKAMSRERAIFLAIAALYDVAEKCNEEATRPKPSLRAILAFLYFHSNGDKEPFTEFWRQCQNEWKEQRRPVTCGQPTRDRRSSESCGQSEWRTSPSGRVASPRLEHRIERKLPAAAVKGRG
jgi:hypothetical protein